MPILEVITRKQEILKVASSLFRIKGYAATSMRDIAREMGMEAASLYNHIASKQRIISGLLMEVAELFTSGMEEIKTSNATPIMQLEALIALHVDLTVSHTNAISLLPAEWVHLEEPTLKAFISLRDAYESDFRELIQNAVKANQLARVDVDVALFSILSTLRWLYSWYTKYQRKDVEILKKELIQNLLYGINLS